MPLDQGHGRVQAPEAVDEPELLLRRNVVAREDVQLEQRHEHFELEVGAELARVDVLEELNGQRDSEVVVYVVGVRDLELAVLDVVVDEEEEELEDLVLQKLAFR